MATPEEQERDNFLRQAQEDIAMARWRRSLADIARHGQVFSLEDFIAQQDRECPEC